jgi:hypothetical protein
VPLSPLWSSLRHEATQGASTCLLAENPQHKDHRPTNPQHTDDESTGVVSFQDAEHAPLSGAVSQHTHQQTHDAEEHTRRQVKYSQALGQTNVSQTHDQNSRRPTGRNTSKHTENRNNDSDSETSSTDNEGTYTGRSGFRRAVVKVIAAAQVFNPDLVLVSAGFDAALGDEGNCVEGAAGTDLLPEDYGFATKAIRDMARACCGGRLVSVLEGGYGCWDNELQVYDRDVLVKCCLAHVRALAQPEAYAERSAA